MSKLRNKRKKIAIMVHLLLVCAGGALGAGLRFLIGRLALRFLGPTFPWGTFSVNIIGSFAMGLLFAYLAKKSIAPQSLWLFTGTGVLGGFTTFSAFSLDAMILWEKGEPGIAMAYIFGSVILSIAALFSGMLLVRATGMGA